MLDTIQRMSNMVMTAYGDSNIIYGGDTIPDESRHFMMRLYQGNDSAPQVWPIINSIVLLALRDPRFGINFVNCFMPEISQLARFSYIDD